MEQRKAATDEAALPMLQKEPLSAVAAGLMLLAESQTKTAQNLAHLCAYILSAFTRWSSSTLVNKVTTQ